VGVWATMSGVLPPRDSMGSSAMPSARKTTYFTAWFLVWGRGFPLRRGRAFQNTRRGMPCQHDPDSGSAFWHFGWHRVGEKVFWHCFLASREDRSALGPVSHGVLGALLAGFLRAGRGGSSAAVEKDAGIGHMDCIAPRKVRRAENCCEGRTTRRGGGAAS
jgi:hypothetical protein